MEIVEEFKGFAQEQAGCVWKGDSVSAGQQRRMTPLTHQRLAQILTSAGHQLRAIQLAGSFTACFVHHAHVNLKELCAKSASSMVAGNDENHIQRIQKLT